MHISSFRSFVGVVQDVIRCANPARLQEITPRYLFEKTNSCTIEPKLSKHKSDENKHDELRFFTQALDFTRT